MGAGILTMLWVAAAAGPVAALPPRGKWTVEFADSMCVAYREYGTTEAPLTLLLKSLPGDSDVEITLAGGRKRERRNKMGEASVVLAPSGQEFAARYFDVFAPKQSRQITQYEVLNIPIEAVSASTAVTLASERVPVRQFALTEMRQLKKVLDQCRDDLLRSWGVDPATLATVVTTARLVTGRITDGDYPSVAISRGERGTVAMRWTVDQEGRPANCIIVNSSGSSELDATSCKLVISRFRYEPARDASGKPVPSLKSQRVSWRLPF